MLGLFLLHSGCSRGTKLDRLPVHGTVTLANGEKLNGSITFLPTEGLAGPAANARLKEGSYQFDFENGPTAGPHTVMIKRIDSRSRAPQMQADDSATPRKSEWNRAVELTNDGQNIQDFQLD